MSHNNDYFSEIYGQNVFTLEQSKLKVIKSYPFIYWISDEFREKFNGDILKDIFPAKAGLQTANNDRFLRYWWEIDSNDISIDWEKDKKKMGSLF